MYVIFYSAGRNGWQIYDSASSLTYAKRLEAESGYKKTRIVDLTEDF